MCNRAAAKNPNCTVSPSLPPEASNNLSGKNNSEIERFIRTWKEKQEKSMREMQRNYSYEHSLLV